MELHSDIFQLVKKEEEAFKLDISVNDNWRWNMRQHIIDRTTYKYGQLKTGDVLNTPMKNIILPILRLRYRTEGFDVKDIEPYVDDKDFYWMSLVVRKYHDDWALENRLDDVIDASSVEDIDVGGLLMKEVEGSKCPEVVPWEAVAFCDQTDALAGAIGLKHNYSVDQLLEMEARGWGKFGTSLSEVIYLAANEKEGSTMVGEKTATPSKYIEVYEVHGTFPTQWAKGEPVIDWKEVKYSRQVHMVCFYGGNNAKNGITLYRGELEKSPFHFRSDAIYNRALGYGGVEELTEAQVWTTYDRLRVKGLLDSASKTIIRTTDPTVVQKHPKGLKNLDNLAIVEHSPNTTFEQMPLNATNLTLFENDISRLEEYAAKVGGASEALFGESPTAGTPFKLQELVTDQSMGLHEYRMGRFASFWQYLYNESIIPKMYEDIIKGKTFLSELDLDDLKYVADKMVVHQWNEYAKEKVLSGGDFADGEQEAWMANWRESFMKDGSKKFIEILKGEFKNKKIRVKVNIKGKQKDMARMVERMTNIFRFAFSNPDGFIKVLQIPGMAKTFNQMLEFSGMSPADFTGIEQMPTAPTAPAGATVPQELSTLAS